jgi:ABC-2 type transport system permease protein
VTTAAAVTHARIGAQPAPVRRTYRFELIKLLAQWPIRLALLACWLGPALVVAIISQQSSLPTDTVFGRWLSQTGWAGPVVVLAFACSWLLPLLTSVVAGDVFATEDRLGTWRHLLVAVRSPRRIFAAKALASLTVILLLAAGLAVSGAVGGLAAVGNRPLVGLDGHLLEPGSAAGTILLAWAAALAPTLAFAAVGLLGSVALARDGLRPPLPHADRTATPSRGHGGATADQRHLRQGRFPRRRCGTGQRLAMRRQVAPPWRHGDGFGHLSARRHPRRAVRRRR